MKRLKTITLGVLLIGCLGSYNPHQFTAISTMADADKTLTVGTDSQFQIITAVLTANRTITLSTTGAANGNTFTIVRKGLGLFTLNVSGLKTVPSATTSTVIVMYDGSAWQLIGYQLL